MSTVTEGAVLDVAFIGCGAIHFGGAEGPWDHSKRLETYTGIRFTAIVDPDTAKARQVLDKKLSGSKSDMYKKCKLYASTDDFLKEESPGLVFLGVPPAYHGSFEPGKDLELKVVSRGLPLFVEKPVSVIDCQEFTRYVDAVNEEKAKHNIVMSVGYMFRYHAAVLKMKELIASHGGRVMALNAHYYTAYSQMDHPFWWDIKRSGGPIVEQATHFCDLARFLVGEVDLASINATCLRENDAGGAGKLGHVKEICEKNVPVEKRIPRVTMATWRFEDGGLGALTHAVALHGEQYETGIDVLMDGLRMTLYEPYTTSCKLLVRDGRTGSDDQVTYHYGDDDPYDRELSTFIAAVRSGDQTTIASSYADAAKTYQFSWAIRLAGEQH